MAFEVTIQCSGHTFSCAPDQSILAAGLQAGYMLPYNCRSGSCRICRSRIVKGEVRYKDMPLDSYLSAADREQGYVLLCQALPCSGLLIDARELVDITSERPRVVPGRIVDLTLLAPDVMRMRIRLPMNENVRYLSGQHLSILHGEVRREYSIANVCETQGMTELELHIRHVPGGAFTGDLFSGAIKPRALVKLELPLGTFFIRENSDRPILLLATGTGFAPVKAMLESLIAKGIHRTRPIHIYWGARRRCDLYLEALARKWAQEHGNIRFAPVLSRPTAECEWTGAVGYVQEHAARDHTDRSNYEIYACGSPAMVRAARQVLTAPGGADPDNFYADEFLTAAHRLETTVQEKQI